MRRRESTGDGWAEEDNEITNHIFLISFPSHFLKYQKSNKKQVERIWLGRGALEQNL
jgi:hypothetical protein